METDRIRRPTPGAQSAVTDLDLRELSLEAKNERIHPLVRSEHVRSEPDHDDVEPLVCSLVERLLELGQRSWTRKTPCRPAGADRRQPRERDPGLTPHSTLTPASRRRSLGRPSRARPRRA